MLNQFSRTELIFGNENMNKLKNKKVAVFGIGGVGGYVVEALARTGIGKFVLVDDDKVSLTNINRQIIANFSTYNQYKCDVMKERILSINPEAEIEIHKCFFLPENQDDFDFTTYDYVVDAVDTVTAKLLIIEKAKKVGTPVISAMGAGNKINPTMLRVGDISDTKVDPLARVMRIELKKRRIKDVKVVYSLEKPIKPIGEVSDTCKEEPSGATLTRKNTARRSIPGSTAFVPSTMGLIIASEIVKDFTGLKNDIKTV
jgi:tRNA A37 threonylcarbamoyladenosine dehydratase